MVRDWHAWYAHYDDPDSSLSRRLRVVREQLAGVLDDRVGPVRLLSLCAGDGRDTLPVLAELAAARAVRATLVELDPDLSGRARRAAAAVDHDVEVRTGDAGAATTWQDVVPADVLMLCGVFGNVPDAHVARTLLRLPELVVDGGVVIWTRGRRVDQDPTQVAGDPAEHVRRLLVGAGHAELAFVSPRDAGFRVGVHRVRGPSRPPDLTERLFEFVG